MEEWEAEEENVEIDIWEEKGEPPPPKKKKKK